MTRIVRLLAVLGLAAAGVGCGNEPVTAPECTKPSDCTKGTISPCQNRTCIANVCGVANKAKDTPLETQTPGDCKVQVCDGKGAVTTAYDDADFYDDGNRCTDDLCESGTATNYPSKAGTECRVGEAPGTCDGAGVCVSINCGNGIIEAGEACDGSSLGGKTCVSEGFVGGLLTCNANCTLNIDACIASPSCGNSTVDAGEECDGDNLDGRTCMTEGYASGVLSCSPACTLVTTACIASTSCGNGTVDLGEQCDAADLGGRTCQSEGYASGTLSCTAGCRLDTDLCVPAAGCGNGTLDPGERCDGTNLNFQTCQSQGFASGILSCTSGCRFDTSRCVPAAGCGNGSIDGTEQCDGANLNGQTCQSQGFASGTLACTPGCRFDTSLCIAGSTCGNGIVDAGEQCDGRNLAHQSCQGLGFTGGILACSPACQFDTSGCLSATCGNGTLDTGEACDGTSLNGQSCESLGYAGGTLTCTGTCQLDTTACIPAASCGNGIIEGTEQCDTGNLNGQTCQSQGFSGGVLACTGGCRFNTAGCFRDPVCGNNVAEGTEACDGGDLRGETCQLQGFDGGALGCTATCTYDVTGCFNLPVCGNNLLEGAEQCDGTNLNGRTCQSQGFAGGNLLCTPNCTFDTSRCIPIGGCGNGSIDGGEQCDGPNLNGQSCQSLGYAAGTLTCAGDCTFNTTACVAAATCGNSIVEGHEECDRANLAGESCQSLGFASGTLSCSGDCTFNTTACVPFATCGNGTVDAGEQCDGLNLGGQSCQSLGFGSGTLTCAGNCTFNTTGCVPLCGNDLAEGAEVCDGSDLRGQTCVSQGFLGGTLACAVNCRSFDTSGCAATPVCGNNVAEGTEACDGSDLRGQTCVSQGFSGGTLTCTGTCAFNTSGCTSAGETGTACLDGVDNNGNSLQDCEESGCKTDGSNVCQSGVTIGGCSEVCNGADDCGMGVADFLACNCVNDAGCDAVVTGYRCYTELVAAGWPRAACALPCNQMGSSQAEWNQFCAAVIGSGSTCQTNGGCSPAVVPPEWTCAAQYYDTGFPDDCDCGCGAFDPDCANATVGACDYCNDPGSCNSAACPGTINPINNAICGGSTGCGNGTIDAGEQCDGANLGGQSCVGLGFAGGTLTCSATCAFDTSACTGGTGETGTACLDGLDNDGNSLQDCEESGCKTDGSDICQSGVTIGGCAEVCNGADDCGMGIADFLACNCVNDAGCNAIASGYRCYTELVAAGWPAAACALPCYQMGSSQAEWNQFCAAVIGSGSTCQTNGGCSPAVVPPEWTCAPQYYATGFPNDCDCGCGAFDPDCANATVGVCDYCNDPGSCNSAVCPGTIDPTNNAVCTGTSTCGNGTINAGEQCDGANLGGQTCVSLGFTGGTLTCSATCTFNTSGCTSGGGETGTACLDGIDNNGNSLQDCEEAGCKTDGSNVCQSGVTIGGCSEVCNGVDDCGMGIADFFACNCVNDAGCNAIASGYRCYTELVSAGWPAAACGLPCNQVGSSQTQWDQFCANVMGSGSTCQTNGSCSPAAVPPQWTCAPQYYDTGFPDDCDCGCGAFDPDCANATVGVCDYCDDPGSCNSTDCPGTIDPTNNAVCTGTSTCGNGTINAGEQCDGANLGGQTCVSLGFTGGTLTCSATCTFNTSGCTGGGSETGAACLDGTDNNGNSLQDCEESGCKTDSSNICQSGVTISGCSEICNGVDDCGMGIADFFACNCVNDAGCNAIASGYRCYTELVSAGWAAAACGLPCNQVGSSQTEWNQFCANLMGSGSTCQTNGSCSPAAVPPQWTCAPQYYDTGFPDDCDCGCGAFDPDCANATVGVCDYCNDPGSCNSADCPGTIDPTNNAVCTGTSTCGNGIINAGEQCDGANLGGQTCVSLGFTGGTLTCSATCTFNTSGCTSGGGETGAACLDGTDNNGNSLQDCEESGCKTDSSNICQSGVTISGCSEVCNGVDDCGMGIADFFACNCVNDAGCNAIASGYRCYTELVSAGWAAAACGLPCNQVGSSQTEWNQFCANLMGSGSTCQTNGSCSPSAVPPQWTCAPQYYDTGFPDDCDCGCGAFDPDCANATVGVCDYCDDPGSCNSADCPGTIDPTNNAVCTGTSTCGNGIINAGEQCDGANLGGQTCVSLGFTGGTLTCSATCTFNTSGCTSGGGETGAACLDGTDNNGNSLQDCEESGCKTDSSNICQSGVTISGCSEICNGVDDCGMGIADFFACNCVNDAGCNAIASGYRCYTELVSAGWAAAACGLPCNQVGSSQTEWNQFCANLMGSGSTCQTNGSCSPSAVPPQWTCAPQYYDTGLPDDCDCGCGAFDPDCANATVGVCDYCDDPGSCNSADCPGTIDPTNNAVCTGTSTCGNGIINAGEQCDGANLGGQTCVSLGFTGGTLTCSATCTFNTSGCTSGGGETGAACLDGTDNNGNSLQDCEESGCKTDSSNICQSGVTISGCSEVCNGVDDCGMGIADFFACNCVNDAGCNAIASGYRCYTELVSAGWAAAACGLPCNQVGSSQTEWNQFCANLMGSGSTCQTNGSCSPSAVPPQWTCAPQYYDTGFPDDCDCGCGAFDPDCANATVGVCDYCDDPGSCNSADCPGTIDPTNNAVCTGGGGSELFISEYGEGNSNNKWVEIFNPGSTVVNLASYQLHVGSNGSPFPGATITLAGTLPPHETFVVCHSAMDTALTAYCNTTTATLNHNGNDAIGLSRGSPAVLIDTVGAFGTDPGTAWDVCGTAGGTMNHVLIRRPSVSQPSIDWAAQSASATCQWNVFNASTLAEVQASHSMGTHTY